MSLTFGEARKILSPYAGRAGYASKSEETALFTRRVLEYLLVTGQYGNLRKFTFCAVRGCFTLPEEVEVIEKCTIDGQIGNVWSRWAEWHMNLNFPANCKFLDNAKELYEDPNYYFTVYDMPPEGARIGAIASCDESEDAFILPQGKNSEGNPIFTRNKGFQVSGEKLSLKKGELVYSKTTFSQLTGIVKSRTNGPVQLVWYDPLTESRGFMSEYSPVEETPSYRRYRISSSGCGAIAKVSILGRIRLKSFYADTDIIPFENINNIVLAGQALQSGTNTEVAVEQARDARLVDMVERENSYKKPQPGQPVEVSLPMSGGAVPNIISRFASGRRWRR